MKKVTYLLFIAICFIAMNLFGQHLNHTTTWIGNSDATHAKHVMQDIENLYVSPSGKVYAITHWDEGGANVQVYESNGTLNPKVEESGTGSWGRVSGRAVTGDDTHVYQVFRQNGCDGQGGTNSFGGPSYPANCETEWQGVRRYKISTGKGEGFTGGAAYDGSMLIMSTNGKVPVGLAWYNNELYVADPNDNKIKVYATNPLTGSVKRSWNITRPGQLAFDGNGFLWMLQPKDGSNVPKLIRYSSTGALQSQSITFSNTNHVVRGFGIDRVNHKIYICNNGNDQNILIYNNITSSPAYSGTFGNTGGMYSGTPGVPGPLKFEGPSGVGVDNSGNIYVANRRDVNCAPQDGTFGMFLEKYNSSGTRQWVKYALEFSDVADVDPGSANGEKLDLFTKAERFEVDFSKPAGQDWIWKGSTIDFRTYPNDPRKIINHNDLVSSPFVRRLNGQKFLFVTNMVTNWLHVYRFKSGSEIAIPSAVFAGANWEHFFPHEPTGSNNNRWLWVDKNGDGQFQSNEYDVGATQSGTSIEGWCVDAQGNVWRISTNGTIDKFNFGGIDSNGVPIYSSSNRQTTSVSTFNNLKRAEYIASSDVMILTGFTNTHNGNDFKSAGRVIARYNNWSSGNRTPAWTISVPYKQQGERDHMMSIAVAGDYIFTVNCWPSLTRVYRLSDGGFVGTMDVNNGVDKKGWADLTHSIRAYQRSNGEYLVMLEENGAAKVVIYRWCPSGNCTGGGSGNCTWTFAANEGGTVNVSGTKDVRYGANGSFITKSVTNSIGCNNTAFGGDPAPGVAKKCEVCETSSSTSLTVKVNASNDDSQQRISDGYILLTSDDLDFRSADLNAVRFRLNVPQGATIESATIRFVAKENKSGDNTLTFKSQASNNANAFTTTNYDISNRSLNSSSVNWNVGSWTDNQTYTTPELKNIVQDVVNRSGWVANNFMAIVVSASTSNVRSARTFDYNGNNSQSPELHVTYSLTKQSALISSTDDIASNGLRLYPNPISGGDLNVDFGEYANGTLLISDINGRIVLSREITNQREITLKYDSFSKGIFIVKYVTGNQVYTHRFIVK